MKKQMHRLLSLMLSLILVVGLIPGTKTAYAVTGGEEPTYSITVSGGTADKTEAKAGEVITITATTPSNMGFRKWLTSDVELADATAATTTFVMPAKKVTIKAENLPLFNVFVIGGSADKTRAFGTETVTITANAPADGMKFVGWTSGKSVKFADARATTTTFTMPAYSVLDITANYEPIDSTSYIVTVINGTSSKYIAKAGDEITITANEKYSKKFTEWTVSGVSLADPTAATATFVMPANDVQVEAQYVDTYSISVTNGSADKTEAAKGEIITITAKEPDEGTRFAGWTSTSGVVFEDASALITTFVMLEKDVTVKANYEGIPVNPSYKITVSGGTADKTEAKEGEVITITANTYSNARFTEWVSGDVTFTDATAATTTFVMPAKDVSIKGNIANLYNVHVIGGSADKSQAVKGETITITANIPEGMEFVEWTTESGVVFADSKATTTTFTMPEKSVLDITATYKEIPVIPTYGITVVGGTPDKYEAKAGEIVTITAYPPASGMRFAKWTTEDGVEFADASAAETTFVMPAGSVRVDATYVHVVEYFVTNATHDGAETPTVGADFVVKFTPAEGYRMTITQMVVKVNGTGRNYGTDWTFDEATNTLTVKEAAIDMDGSMQIFATAEKIPTEWAVEYDVTNATHNGADKAAVGADFVVKFTPAEGYRMTITQMVVKVNSVGQNYGTDWIFDETTNTLTIKAATVDGDIKISATAEKIPTEWAVTYDVTNATHDGADKANVGEDFVVKFTPTEGYRMTITQMVVKVNSVAKNYGTDWTFDEATNTLTIKAAAIDGNVQIFASAVSINGAGNSDTPQTGDNSMIWLWIALLFVIGAGVVATTVFWKKRFSVK